VEARSDSDVKQLGVELHAIDGIHFDDLELVELVKNRNEWRKIVVFIQAYDAGQGDVVTGLAAIRSASLIAAQMNVPFQVYGAKLERIKRAQEQASAVAAILAPKEITPGEGTRKTGVRQGGTSAGTRAPPPSVSNGRDRERKKPMSSEEFERAKAAAREKAATRKEEKEKKESTSSEDEELAKAQEQELRSIMRGKSPEKGSWGASSEGTQETKDPRDEEDEEEPPPPSFKGPPASATTTDLSPPQDRSRSRSPKPPSMPPGMSSSSSSSSGTAEPAKSPKKPAWDIRYGLSTVSSKDVLKGDFQNWLEVKYSQDKAPKPIYGIMDRKSGEFQEAEVRDGANVRVVFVPGERKVSVIPIEKS